MARVKALYVEMHMEELYMRYDSRRRLRGPPPPAPVWLPLDHLCTELLVYHRYESEANEAITQAVRKEVAPSLQPIYTWYLSKIFKRDK